MHYFSLVVNKADPLTLVNETRDLGKAERDLVEPSFPELGRNSIFIKVIVNYSLFHSSSHYRSLTSPI